MENLEKELKRVEFDIERWKEYVLNAEVIRDSFRYSSLMKKWLSTSLKSQKRNYS